MQDIQFLIQDSDFTIKKDTESNAIKGLITLKDGSGKGSDFLGWLNLPEDIRPQIADIKQTANSLCRSSDYIVCIGIGGSYLGAKAVIEALQSSFAAYETKRPQILYAGQNIGEDYMTELMRLLKGKRFSIICISKSGTTTEPAIAFRLLKNQLEKQAGKAEAKKLIVCITDKAKGALRTLADQEGYKTFVIEDNIGGRFSVLSPVGLLPIACAGFDIEAFVNGADRMMRLTQTEDMQQNIALQYAATRNILYSEQGKKIELLANFHPKLHYVSEWWKQLYGESEGKEGKGLFPASVDFTTDLHSMGQYIQEGERLLFETVISVLASNNELCIPTDENNLDGLNYLAGKRIDEVNKMAEQGTMMAHRDGGVTNLRITIPQLNEYYLGELIYFFEIACGISGYMLDVNPFNQPGVEAYKKNMFALLKKPGYC